MSAGANTAICGPIRSLFCMPKCILLLVVRFLCYFSCKSLCGQHTIALWIIFGITVVTIVVKILGLAQYLYWTILIFIRKFRPKQINQIDSCHLYSPVYIPTRIYEKN
jgi:hypothetical protein